jgi:hypothetical protein
MLPGVGTGRVLPFRTLLMWLQVCSDVLIDRFGLEASLHVVWSVFTPGRKLASSG